MQNKQQTAYPARYQRVELNQTHRARCGWAHVLKILIQHVRHHAQYVWQIAVGDLVFEIADNNVGEVAAHEMTGFAPTKRNRPGWSARSIMRPSKVFAISSTSDCVGHCGSGNAFCSLAKVVLYPSTPSSPLLVTCVHSVLASSQPARLVSFQRLSKFCVGTWHKTNLSLGLVASARRKRLMTALSRYCIAKFSTITSFLAPLVGT